MMNRLEKLSDYGVNLPQVMARFVDDENLYLECLTILLSDSAFDTLQTAILSCAYSVAFEQAHTRKGVAGNLGLTPLSTQFVILWSPCVTAIIKILSSSAAMCRKKSSCLKNFWMVKRYE